MTRQRLNAASEKGIALVHMAITLTVLLLFAGLAADSGRAYVVKAQLSKAVDGAALSAARNVNGGDPRGEAGRIFNANFPPGFMGSTSVTDPATDPDFFDLQTIAASGISVVTVKASAVMPTSFMRLGGFNDVTVSSSGEATRRLVDLSLVVDVSGSIGPDWPAVRDAVRDFIGAFDETSDRLSLATFSSGARVLAPMPATRGFDKSGLQAAVPNTLPGGFTSMAEGLYRGWDEVRTVSAGQQSGLRVIVLFTDGSGNIVPGLFDTSGIAKGVATSDFPRRSPDPTGLTTDTPTIQGLYHTETGNRSPNLSAGPFPWNSTQTYNDPSGTVMEYLPLASRHDHRRSSGIPISFPLQTAALNVDGVSQQTRRGLRNFDAGAGRYPAQIFNIRNAATNLTEIIADAARADASGSYPIRIFTIGMGSYVRMALGTRPETSESVLMRIANDERSPDFNPMQLDGKYYFAATGADVGPAFQQLQSQIVRLTK